MYFFRLFVSCFDYGDLGQIPKSFHSGYIRHGRLSYSYRNNVFDNTYIMRRRVFDYKEDEKSIKAVIPN